MKKTVLIKILLSVLAAVGIVLILNANLLFPWQKEARKNKRAVFEYVNVNYPDAKFIRSYYRTTQINLGNPGHDQFVFEQDGIRFPIFAEHGRIANDFYWKAFAEYQLYNTYIKPFEESRNITAKFNYIASDLQKFFRNNPKANISQFDGSVDFVVLLHNNDSSTNPKSLGWLYDFYCYCKENVNIPRYTVTIICKGSSTIFTNESEFENEDGFYKSFC
ncbi:MAG: hypothetical protein HDT42_11180 [Ruminococcaceae bacterium]|nr:hypothetical protein [Oscillospiraceae bacterium]